MTWNDFGWFVLGAGSALFGVMIGFLWDNYRSRKRFNGFLDGINSASEEFVKDQVHREKIEKGTKEISELSFRDKHGVMNTVRIIIDHDMADMKVGSKQDMEGMLRTGEAGTLSDLMAGHKVSEDAMGKVQEFVFSPQAVRDMRSSGLEPDEVVTKMLRASGRME